MTKNLVPGDINVFFIIFVAIETDLDPEKHFDY